MPTRTATADGVSTDLLTVDTASGAVRGVVRRGLRMWRGLPYATAPVGALRFRAPQPPRPWDGVRDATHFGPVAVQDRKGPFVGASRTVVMSEECLSLNVIAPGEASVVPLPVMVWIHGGAYTVGSSQEMDRQGEVLVREGGVIFVNFNYRLGALGYLDFSSFSTPERTFESNLGLRDQVAALEWVRDNIAMFGGDPGNVTLFGESAGANAVTTLLAVPRARGLFARAIAESPPADAVYGSETTAVWAGEFLELLTEIVDDHSTDSTSHEDAAALLDAAPLDALVRAATRMQLLTPDVNPGTISFCPVIDGDFLPERPIDAIDNGHAHPVPLIIGTNDREGSLFRGRLDILATTPPRIRAIFAKTKKKARKRLKALYPGLPDKRAAADFGGDYSFWYPSIRVAERHADVAPVHFYRFDLAPRLIRLMGLDATHGIEMFAVFDKGSGLRGRAIGVLGGYNAFQATGRRMRANWLRFAHTGRVDPSWPTYTSRKRNTLIIDETDRVEQDPRGDKRRAWQEFVPHV
ncbi:carboxylesterase/lipase family protein [Lacisediminihabitans changchengi]|uniref:Carboxylic ester hydrolase n=1 Tax=Lacisediminihabitans changchengi TaxID=2787634 RepID=A0A934SKT2_9MICO|nr:carboxylesterase/lipase family protein [Lacisediminihabitans changchengi]MBK4346722.1 carboxylesterase/lipase family protein [Lacisediminihabitans changchengi]MBK4348155.1 carboxylesterase/lipase family protein [Lacisediminihabitans changchengi]